MNKLNRLKRIKETGVRYDPITIENSAKVEHAIDFNNPEDVEKLTNMTKNDEFEHILNGTDYPKILVTTSIQSSKKLEKFLFEFKLLFHNRTCNLFRRKKVTLRNLIKWSTAREYTHIIVVQQNHRLKSVADPGLIVDQLLIIKLPAGPSAWIRVSGVELWKQIKKATLPVLHYPELVFKNFGTWIGARIKRLLQSLYPWDKNQLKDKEERNKHRRIVSYWCQRDFIFIRHHRWDFNPDSLNMRKIVTNEVGPRMSLKVTKLKKGLFGDKKAPIEFEQRAKM